MDGAVFKKPFLPKQRIIVKVLPWKVPHGYGDVVPENAREWLEVVDPAMSLNALCTQIKSTFENDLHYGKGTLRIKYLLTAHGVLIPRSSSGTVRDHFDDARGQFHRPDCTVQVEREPPSLDELRSVGSLRFASVAPQSQIPAKRRQEREFPPPRGLTPVPETSGTDCRAQKRRRTEDGSFVATCDSDQAVSPNEDREGTATSQRASIGVDRRTPVAVADSQEIVDEIFHESYATPRSEAPESPRLSPAPGVQSTVIPETLEHAEAPLSSIESLHHQDAGSESPKSEFPEPGSALQDLAPSKLVTPGAASAVASSRRHTNVQAVINGDDDRDAAVGEKTPCSRKRARQDSERPNGVVHPETPNQALAAQAGRKARLSNPRSLSKSSRAKAELRRAAKDLFAVPSDIDSTQEGPLSAQRRGINQGPVRRLNGSKFKPFPREKADQSNVERPPKSVRANGVEHVMSHRAQIAVEQQVPVPLSTPQRVAESDQRKTPHPPAAVVSAQPDQPGQTRRTPQEESPNNVASAAPASASAVNADSRATGSPSNKKSVGEDESEDVEMHDAPTGDESDTSGGSDATDPLRTGAEPKASIPKSKREPPRDPGSVDETSDNSDESPAPSAKSTKKANNGINHTNSTASLPCDVSNCEAEKVTEKTLEPLGESGSEKVTSESEGSQEVSDEVEKTREVAQVPQKKSVSKPPRLVKRVKDVRRASSSKERGRTESVTGPLPSPSRSPSRSSLAEGSASPSLQAATSEAGPNKAKKPSLRQALSNRRSVSFMEDSGARNSPLPAQIGRVRASDDSAQPKARASPAEPKAPASRRSSSTSINPFKTVQSAGRKSFYADLFQTFRKSLKPETNNETDKAVKTAAPVTKGKGAARSSKQGTPETKEKEKPKAVKSAESTAPNPPGKRTKTIAKKSLPKSSSDEGSDEKPPARTSKERTVNGTAKASTGRTNSNLTRRRPSAAEKPAANVRRARESTTTTDSAITDVKSVKNVEAKNRSLTQPTSVSREHSPSAVEVSSSADSKTQGTGLRDSTRSRSPAKAVESSLESDAGEDDNSSSNGDLRKPSREEAATDANATIPNQNSETDEEDDEESANEEEIETQLPPGHASLPGHQSAALPNDRSRDVKASRHDKSAKQDDETSSSGPTESSDASDDGAEDETSGHASINHESSVKESESGSSEPDDESTSVAEKTTLLDDVRSPVTQIGEEDGAAKQLHMEASECAMQSSPVSKTPALLYSSSQFAAKALSSNANPNSSFGRTPTFTELKKQSFVAAPVPHANLRNRAYKMPLNRQPPTKRTSVEGSSDSSEYESSEDGGMEDLYLNGQDKAAAEAREIDRSSVFRA